MSQKGLTSRSFSAYSLEKQHESHVAWQHVQESASQQNFAWEE